MYISLPIDFFQMKLIKRFVSILYTVSLPKTIEFYVSIANCKMNIKV